MDKKDLLAYYRAQKVDRERMYTKPFRRYQQRRRLEVVHQLAAEDWAQRRDRRLLDVGCGDGYGISVVLDGLDYSQFIGLDLSSEKLAAARENLKNSHVLMGDAEGLPFSDQSLDLAFSLETLEHLMDPAGALGEIERVLRPGGVFFLSVPVKSGLNAVLLRRLIAYRRNRRFLEHLQAYTLKKISRLLKEAGLEPRRHRFCVFNYPGYELFTRVIPYRAWRFLDSLLSRLPFGFVGLKYGLSFGVGNEYLVVKAEKTG